MADLTGLLVEERQKLQDRLLLMEEGQSRYRPRQRKQQQRPSHPNPFVLSSFLALRSFLNHLASFYIRLSTYRVPRLKRNLPPTSLLPKPLQKRRMRRPKGDGSVRNVSEYPS